jgi:hypothetical protein
MAEFFRSVKLQLQTHDCSASVERWQQDLCDGNI